MRDEDIGTDKHNKLEFPKKLLEAFMITQFFTSGMSAGVPVHILFEEIEDVKLEGDQVIITYHEVRYR